MPEETNTTGPSLLARFAVPLAIVLIVLLGGVLRIRGLGASGVPGDELELWRVCGAASSAGAILRGEVKHDLYPLMPAMIKAVQDGLGLGLSPFSLRLPGALVGLLCIPFVFLCGRRLYGPWGGLGAALLLALSPVHIQCSREAYPYVLSTTGALLALWAALAAGAAAGAGRRPGAGAWVGFAAGVALMVNSSVAGLPVAAVHVLVFAAALAPLALRKPRRPWPLAAALAVALLIALPRAWAFLVSVVTRGSTKYAQAAAHAPDIKLFDPTGLQFAFNFGWGSTPARLAFAAIVLALAAGAVALRRRDRLVWLNVAALVGVFAATMVSRYVTGNPFITRFLSPMLPGYVLLLTGGLMALVPREGGGQGAAARRSLAVLLWLCAIGLLARPAMLAATLEGTPTQYARIVRWADSNLKPGTPVVCDRFFTAWNEFQVNAPTSVVFMATIPNEPVDRYLQDNWRGSVESFCEHNPDAAYYDARMFWNKLGPWEWPAQYFARKREFIEERFHELDRIGLSYRTSGVPKDWQTRTIYYNTPADVAAKAKARGQALVVIPGNGWRYHKTEDLRDWRVMMDVVELDIMNTTTSPVTAVLRLSAAAAGDIKRVQGPGGEERSVAANRLGAVDFGPLTIAPGSNEVRLADPDWSRRRIPLLVEKMSVVVVGGAR